MDLKQAFGRALRETRSKRGLSQEDFSTVSSRTYLSTLERGIKSPTLEKVESIAGRLDVHPLTLMVLTYLQSDKSESVDGFLTMIASEVEGLEEGSK